jgi:hypothetical protein
MTLEFMSSISLALDLYDLLEEQAQYQFSFSYSIDRATTHV